MFNSKYRRFFLATGVSVFLMMQFDIFLNYQVLFGKSGAQFSALHYLNSFNGVSVFLSIVSCVLLWIGSKANLDAAPVRIKN